MRKVLFVEQNQDGTVGGSYYTLLYLVRALDKKRYDPIVMFYQDNHMVKKFSDEDCRVVIYNKPVGKVFTPPHPILDIPNKIFQKAYNLFNVSLIPLFHFLRFIVKNNIDLIHLNNSANIGVEWLLASKILRKKCITHQRGFMRFSQMAMISRQFDKIICVSCAVRRSLPIKDLGEKVLTLYDGTDLNEFCGRIKKDVTGVRNEFGVSASTPLIGMIGNFREWKGQRVVVKAIAIVKDKYPDLMCLLIGDIATTNAEDVKYFQEIKQEINIKHLDKNIFITGYRDDVPDLMNACDVILHSSIEPEPFGMVVIEAMLLRKPVIATDHGGPKEIIDNGVSGYLIPPGDAIILAEKIDFLLQNPETRNKIGERGSHRVIEKFSMKRFAENVNKLYGDLFH